MAWMMVAGLALAAGPIAADDADPVLPAWMAGCWEQRVGDKWTEECWMPPRGGIMLGASRSGRGDKLSDWEAMQIVVDQPNGDGPIVRMAYWAAPGGTNRTLFVWAPSDQGGVTFHNVANDYPQRIRYWREGEKLMAETSLKDGSKPMRWSYHRQ